MGNATIIKVIYHDIEMNKHEATINSSFYHEIDSAQATGKYGTILSTTPVNHTYKIDGNCVDRETFNGVINLFKGANSTVDFDVSFDNLTHIDKPIKIVFEGESTFGESINKKASNTNDKAKVMLSGYSNWSDEQLKEFIDRDIFIIYSDINGNYCEATINSSFSRDIDYVQVTGRYGVTLFTAPTSCTYKIDDNCVDYDTLIKVMFLLKKINNIKNKNKHLDTIRGKRADCCVYDDCMYIRGSVCTQLKEILNSIEKENEDMVKIVNYKYNEEKGLTEITWSDKTITRVVAGDDTEKSAYVGFVSACAKKLFGNKSTYLNQFDKWTVKIPERERLAAEKKAKEDKEREETKARKAAKKAERRAKREVELLAKEFADNYKHESVWEQAKKLAMKKYGVPTDYFLDERYNCHCGCKEFDVMDEDENNISD